MQGCRHADLITAMLYLSDFALTQWLECWRRRPADRWWWSADRRRRRLGRSN